jgi:signal transduction histidine kinase
MTVDDRGPGVAIDQRERIFQAFYRLPGASEQDGGVGLGLALVKTIVNKHLGSVRCEERPGGGARFVVEMPLTGS